MALASGTRLGPYEVFEPLGAGGMGATTRLTTGICASGTVGVKDANVPRPV